MVTVSIAVAHHPTHPQHVLQGSDNIEYQLRVAGNERVPDGKVPEVRVNGVGFDGFAYTGQPSTPTLNDTKNGYAFLQNPNISETIVKSILKSAQRQVDSAAEARATVTWIVSTKAGADALRRNFRNEGIQVDVLFLP